MSIPQSYFLHFVCRVLALILVVVAARIPGHAIEASDTADIAVEKPLRPVRSTYAVEFGSAHLADTYLTPLHYSGWHAGFTYEHLQAMKFDPQRWSMQLRLGLDFDRTQNPAKNATMMGLSVEASWGMLRKFTIIKDLTVAIGPELGANLGCLYLSRNGNNPASAKAAITLNATALAAYRMKIWKVPVTFTFQPSLACLGAFFSPDYGQLYYQIYLGERSGLAHCAWWGNYFSMDNRLAANLHLGSTTLHLGYHNTLLSTKANNLVANAFTHSFSLGVTLDWLAFRAGEIKNVIPAY